MAALQKVDEECAVNLNSLIDSSYWFLHDVDDTNELMVSFF
jgi:hypothetical protein